MYVAFDALYAVYECRYVAYGTLYAAYNKHLYVAYDDFLYDPRKYLYVIYQHSYVAYDALHAVYKCRYAVCGTLYTVYDVRSIFIKA